MTTTAAEIDRSPLGPPCDSCHIPWVAPLLQLVAAALVVLPGCGPPKAATLDGKLTVLVRPADRTIEPVPLEQAGSLPVQSGGAMVLDAQLSEPAYMYFVWLDSEGRVLPFYPWNNETLEVEDINEPPPARRPSKLVFSPLLGRAWNFGSQGGSETVLLLARRTPLPTETKLGSLIYWQPQDKAA